MTWILWGIGILFCLSGLFLLFKRLFEEGKKIIGPVLVIIMGVILVGLGTAIHLGLV